MAIFDGFGTPFVCILYKNIHTNQGGNHRLPSTVSPNLFSAELPESDGGGCGDVERIDLMRHRDADNVVGGGNGGVGETITLRAEDDGETILLLQYRVVQRDAVVRERHGGCPETMTLELGDGG